MISKRNRQWNNRSSYTCYVLAGLALVVLISMTIRINFQTHGPIVSQAATCLNSPGRKEELDAKSYEIRRRLEEMDDFVTRFGGVLLAAYLGTGLGLGIHGQVDKTIYGDDTALLSNVGFVMLVVFVAACAAGCLAYHKHETLAVASFVSTAGWSAFSILHTMNILEKDIDMELYFSCAGIGCIAAWVFIFQCARGFDFIKKRHEYEQLLMFCFIPAIGFHVATKHLDDLGEGAEASIGILIFLTIAILTRLLKSAWPKSLLAKDGNELLIVGGALVMSSGITWWMYAGEAGVSTAAPIGLTFAGVLIPLLIFGINRCLQNPDHRQVRVIALAIVFSVTLGWSISAIAASQAEGGLSENLAGVILGNITYLPFAMAFIWLILGRSLPWWKNSQKIFQGLVANKYSKYSIGALFVSGAGTSLFLGLLAGTEGPESPDPDAVPAAVQGLHDQVLFGSLFGTFFVTFLWTAMLIFIRYQNSPKAAAAAGGAISDWTLGMGDKQRYTFVIYSGALVSSFFLIPTGFWHMSAILGVGYLYVLIFTCLHQWFLGKTWAKLGGKDIESWSRGCCVTLATATVTWWVCLGIGVHLAGKEVHGWGLAGGIAFGVLLTIFAGVILWITKKGTKVLKPGWVKCLVS